MIGNYQIEGRRTWFGVIRENQTALDKYFITSQRKRLNQGRRMNTCTPGSCSARDCQVQRRQPSDHQLCTNGEQKLKTPDKPFTPALFLVLIFQLTLTDSLAASEFNFYKNFSYGSSKSEVIATDPGIYDCSDEFDEDNWLCLDNNSFANTPINLAFGFVDDALVSVSIFSKFSSQSYIDFVSTLNSKMQLISISDGNGSLDLVEEQKKLEPSDLLKKLSDFEQRALNNGNITYVFFNRESFLKSLEKSENFPDFVLKMSEDTRVAEYTVMEDDEGAYSMIRFSALKRQLHLIMEKSSKSTEDF